MKKTKKKILIIASIIIIALIVIFCCINKNLSKATKLKTVKSEKELYSIVNENYGYNDSEILLRILNLPLSLFNDGYYYTNRMYEDVALRRMEWKL